MAPHTSNWDLVLGLLGRFAVGVKMNFLAKHQLFVFPLNLLMKVLGEIDRKSCQEKLMLWNQSVELFQHSERLVSWYST